jgi:hypothetical protein
VLARVRLWIPVFGCLRLCAISFGIAVAQAQDIAPPPAGSVPTASRLIIKFRTADTNPSRADYLAQLFRDTGVQLTYVRAMAGGAHLFQLQRPLDGPGLDAVLERLGKRPEVLYVEPERRLHHMKM